MNTKKSVLTLSLLGACSEVGPDTLETVTPEFSESEVIDSSRKNVSALQLSRVENPPSLPELTEDEFKRRLIGIASRYEFKFPEKLIPSDAMSEINMEKYNPSFVEQVMDGNRGILLIPEQVTLKGPSPYPIENGATLKIENGIPQLCVTPETMGGTFPEEWACSALPKYEGKNQYSINALLPVFILREGFKSALKRSIEASKKQKNNSLRN